MKAAFAAEAVGHGNSGELHLLRRLHLDRESPWVAEITGPDMRFTYQRRFLPPKVDYHDANSKATRGVWYWWTLESGRVYETKYRTSWNAWHRHFLKVTADGDVVHVSRQEVDRWLSGDLELTS